MADEFNLEEINFTGEPIAKDPTPNEKAKKTSSRTSTRSVGRPSKDSQKKEVAEELAGFLKLGNLGLMSRDLHEVYNEKDEIVGYESCLGVYVTLDNKGMPTLTPAGNAFCEAAADIIVDSPFMMKVLHSGDNVGKWLRLVMALQPLVLTVIANHNPRRNHELRAVPDL